MKYFERPLRIGKKDNFTLTLSKEYLKEEPIISIEASTKNSFLKIEGYTIEDNVISVRCKGLEEGSSDLHFEWTTGTRSGCKTCYINVLPC